MTWCKILKPGEDGARFWLLGKVVLARGKHTVRIYYYGPNVCLGFS